MSNLIKDFISGTEIKATPEELDAVQPFSTQLVEDYGYPKENISTHPQHRVMVRPSDSKKSYPVDIAVFKDKTKKDDECLIIVECKKKNEADGVKQLQQYLKFSEANLGVWFNGNERKFYRKIEKDGKVYFDEIPNIPKYGQRIEDVGLYKRKDLKPTKNLRLTFKSIRNFLAGNAVGATRDEVFAQQIINLIFCKLYDEKFTAPDDIVRFRAGVDEDEKIVAKRIKDLFQEVKRKYKEVIDMSDSIELDNKSIVYTVGELQSYCLTDAERDVIADAFETFIGPALKGAQGQFFTPRNVVKMMVELLDPNYDDMVIDPACGSGGFLVESLKYIWSQLDQESLKFNWADSNLKEEKMEVALTRINGIDKDYFLTKVAKAYMAILGDGRGGIFTEDSLDSIDNWKTEAQSKINLGKYSIVLTNPPFGKDIKVTGEDKLRQYDLGHKWKYDKSEKIWTKGKINTSQTPQILFLERCLELLKDGGKMAVVLPDGILGNDNLGYVRQYLINKARLIAVIDIPMETFQPNTQTKTSVMVLKKTKDIEKDYPVFMCIAETCGHDRTGKSIEDDDIQLVVPEFRKWLKDNKVNF